MDLKIITQGLEFLEFVIFFPQISSKSICWIFYILVKPSIKYKYHKYNIKSYFNSFSGMCFKKICFMYYFLETYCYRMVHF